MQNTPTATPSTVFEKGPLTKLVEQKELVGYIHKGFWQCMDTLREKQKLEQLWEAGKDYAEIHDNKRKIVLMHYPVFCYNGQFRRGADGTPLTYMLHGHIHKTPDQELVDRFCTETRAMMRKSAHQETAQPVPCQMINCFCMYSDYTPLTLEEWVECNQRRRNKADCG